MPRYGCRAAYLMADPPPVVRGLGLQAVPGLFLGWIIDIWILQQLLDSRQDLPSTHTATGQDAVCKA